MDTVKTTLRLPKALKKEVERHALEADLTMQEVTRRALTAYLSKQHMKKTKKLVLRDADLGGLDNLTRDFYYEDPT